MSSSRDMWWRDAIVYEVYVRSFADGDGDGVGDLPGVRSRLPYLRDLGVDAVWLTPFFPSPMADHGYDVADYRDVDPLFGTLEDFDALIVDAHRLGLRVVIDLVPNHTSSRHPWFREALASPSGSAQRDRYVFRPAAPGAAPPNNWTSVFGGPAWSRADSRGGHAGDWYLHLFAPEQPDLNWRNAEVRREFEEVLRFWLDRGVDGFRIDVAMGLFKAEGLPDKHAEAREPDREGFVPASPHWGQSEVHDVYRRWRRILDSYPGGRIAVAEAWATGPEDLARYVRSDELHQAFNFAWLKAPWSAAAFREVVDDSLAATSLVGATTTWVLSSHDEPRHVTRYGDGVVGLRRARAAALTTLALPGSAYVYQGEELGLPEVTDLPDAALQDPIWRRSGYRRRGRDGCRVPIPWYGEHPPYGFTRDGVRPWLPMPEGWAALSAETQARDPASTLSLYRSALRLRRDHPALGDGTMRWVDVPGQTVAFARDPGFVCVMNCGDRPVRLPRHRGVLVTSDLTSDGVDDGRLPANAAAWLEAD